MNRRKENVIMENLIIQERQKARYMDDNCGLPQLIRDYGDVLSKYQSELSGEDVYWILDRLLYELYDLLINPATNNDEVTIHLKKDYCNVCRSVMILLWDRIKDIGDE